MFQAAAPLGGIFRFSLGFVPTLFRQVSTGQTCPLVRCHFPFFYIALIRPRRSAGLSQRAASTCRINELLSEI